MSNLMHLLDRPIAYQPSFIALGAGVTGAVLLSQLVYWHNRMDGWFYKTQAEITAETGLTRYEQEGARKKLIAAGVLEEKLQGVPAKLFFRINAEALEARLLQFAGNQHSSMRKTSKQGCVKSAAKNAEKPQASLQQTTEPVSGNPASIHTGDYTETTTEIKTSCPVAAQPDDKSADDFLSRHPMAVVYSIAKRQWGSQEDLTCAEWIWKRIKKLYEDAAESDAEVAIPKEPNWTIWANEVRLMCSQDGRTHRQICELFGRANKDPFWFKNILSPSKLREKWEDLTLKLPKNGSGSPVKDDPAFRASYDDVDYSQIPDGFRGYRAE